MLPGPAGEMKAEEQARKQHSRCLEKENIGKLDECVVLTTVKGTRNTYIQ